MANTSARLELQDGSATIGRSSELAATEMCYVDPSTNKLKVAPWHWSISTIKHPQTRRSLQT